MPTQVFVRIVLVFGSDYCGSPDDPEAACFAFSDKLLQSRHIVH
jgi:hypothetical protein